MIVALLTATTVILMLSTALFLIFVEFTHYWTSDEAKITLITLEIITTWAFFFCIILGGFAEIRLAVLVLCIVFVIDALAHTHSIRNNTE